MENEYHLPTNLKYLRTQNFMTQEEVGKIINKGASAIGNYEQGIRDISAVDIGKLANFFNIHIDDLIFKDLRFQNIDIDDKNYIIMPKDYKKYKKGEKVPVQEILDYVEQMQNKIEKIRNNLDI